MKRKKQEDEKIRLKERVTEGDNVSDPATEQRPNFDKG